MADLSRFFPGLGGSPASSTPAEQVCSISFLS